MAPSVPVASSVAGASVAASSETTLPRRDAPAVAPPTVAVGETVVLGCASAAAVSVTSTDVEFLNQILLRTAHTGQRKRRHREAIGRAAGPEDRGSTKRAEDAQVELNIIEDAEALSREDNIMTLPAQVLEDKVNSLTQRGVTWPPNLREALLCRTCADQSNSVLENTSDVFEPVVDTCLPYKRATGKDEPEVDVNMSALEDGFDPLNLSVATITSDPSQQAVMFERSICEYVVCPIIVKTDATSTAYISKRFGRQRTTLLIGMGITNAKRILVFVSGWHPRMFCKTQQFGSRFSRSDTCCSMVLRCWWILIRVQ